MDIGFQLYSARNYPLAEVLKKIGTLGYTHAEGYGGVYGDPKGLKAKLDDHGLTMPTGHIGLDQLEKPAETIRLAETLGMKVVICPWLSPDQRPTDASGWRRFGEQLQRLARPYQDAGLTFGYHNHDFEFAKFGADYAMDLLLEAAPDVSVEADIAWIARGKADPKPWLEKFGKRIVAVHIKDIAAPGQNVNEDGWADVGHGVLPWQGLLATAKSRTSARYFIVEHDNPSDIDRFASRSIAAIENFGA
ncbi:MAG: sugar phosphate isomerase/epimerase family protein [Devosia sp.]